MLFPQANWCAVPTAILNSWWSYAHLNSIITKKYQEHILLLQFHTVMLMLERVCRRIEPTVPAAAVLKKGDVLLRFDDTIIGVDGTVPFRSGERINFSYLISKKQNDDQASFLSIPRIVSPDRFLQSSMSWHSSLRFGERLTFSHLVSQKQNDDQASAFGVSDVLRWSSTACYYFFSVRRIRRSGKDSGVCSSKV